jgi:hypothetical protein
MNRIMNVVAGAYVIGYVAFAALPATAQEGQVPDTNAAIHLPPGQLKAYEGYFQFSQSKDQVIQFKLNGDTLEARLLWNNATLHIVPESDSIFHTVEAVEGRNRPIKFIRNPEGAYAKMFLMGQNLAWNRIKDYKPLVRTEIAHTPAQLKTFEGTYTNPDTRQYLGLTEKDNKLVLHPYWGGDDVEFVPDSPMHFFCKEQLLFTLQFVAGKDGLIIRMIAFGRDIWDKTSAVSLTPGQMKAFEGKYRFKTDPDDIIQITASGLNLVIRQLWDGKETIVSPKTNVFFYNQEKGYLLTFDEDGAGVVTGAFVLGNDYFEKIKN